MADHYINHSEALMGQPKRTIGKYVAQNGILVPRIFDGFREAIAFREKTGKEVLARSEHQDEYAGASGILETRTLNFETYPEKLSALGENALEGGDVSVFEKGIADFVSILNERSVVDVYCGLTGKDVDEFRKGISVSYWEQIPGFNRMVVADNAVQGRYHIVTNFGDFFSADKFHNYIIYDNGTLLVNLPDPLDKIPMLAENVEQLIELYERIRSLPNFDENHCPIMEVQTSSDGEDYFLQYHRTHCDFSPPNFVLDRPLEEGEIKANWVRGATSSEGITVETVLIYGAEYTGKWSFTDMKATCDLASSFHDARLLGEVVSKYADVVMHSRDLEGIAAYSTRNSAVDSNPHWERSGLFKPPLSIAIYGEHFLREGERESMKEKAKATGENQGLTLKFTSDGRNAYVKRMD